VSDEAARSFFRRDAVSLVDLRMLSQDEKLFNSSLVLVCRSPGALVQTVVPAGRAHRRAHRRANLSTSQIRARIKRGELLAPLPCANTCSTTTARFSGRKRRRRSAVPARWRGCDAVLTPANRSAHRAPHSSDEQEAESSDERGAREIMVARDEGSELGDSDDHRDVWSIYNCIEYTLLYRVYITMKSMYYYIECMLL
jgi:hypothetical protein